MEEKAKDYPSKNEAIIVLIVTFVFLFIISGLFSEAVMEGKKEGFLLELFIIVPAIIFVRHKGYSAKKIFRLNMVGSDVILYSLLIGLSLIVLSEEFERIVKIVFPFPEGIDDIENKMRRDRSKK